jgi:DNA-binding MarR family transcriptional regulator
MTCTNVMNRGSVTFARWPEHLASAGVTKGNLSAHLARLEDAGYVEIEKGFRGKLPQTMCRLTPEGCAAFQVYCERLRRAMAAIPTRPDDRSADQARRTSILLQFDP